ncbi:MAG: CHAT domain-containing protein [Sphingomonadaceae bacterium]|nr:CHAT domain-containing protein [Sphingomonadaceae bacterium]
MLALSAAHAPLSAGEATLAEMRARDRLAPPETELAAWQAFAAGRTGPDQPLVQRAEIHLGLAIAHLYAKQFTQGWSEIEAADALVAQMDSPPPYAAELNAYAALLLTELDRLDEADQRARSALAFATARGESAFADQAIAHNALAGIAFARNDLPAAEGGYCTARDLGLRAASPYHAMIVNDASSCGVVKFFLERPDTLPAMQLARDHALAHLPPDHPKMGNVLNSSYGVLLRYGRYGEAEPLIRRHLELERRLHSGDVDDIYDPLSMLGRVLELRELYPEAETVMRAAAAMADRLHGRSQPYNRGMSHTNLARILARQGRLEEAVTEARAGLARLEEDLEPGDTNIGTGQVQLADHLARIGATAEALALVDTGLALLTARLPADHSEVLGAELIRARILADAGRMDEALTLARAATGTFESRMFDLAASETERIALSRVLPAAFADLIEVALAAGSPDDAVHGAQLFLLSELAVPNARISAATLARDQGLAEQVVAFEKAREEAATLGKALTRAQAEGSADAAGLTASLAEAEASALAAQATLNEAFPGYAALARPQVPSLAQLQAGLGEREMLVLPLALPDKAVTLAVTRGSVTWDNAAIAPTALNDLAARVQESARQPGQFDSEAAHALFRAVFPGKISDALAQADRLVFPASGYLARLSPALLLAAPHAADRPLADAPFLVRSHSVRITASPAAQAPDGEARIAGGFLGIGAPSALPDQVAGSGLRSALGVDLPPLPRARTELEGIAAALGEADPLILTDAAASEASIAALGGRRYGVIAFATHGLVGGELPGLDEPALLLAQVDPARPDGDGLLTASEIAMLRLDADWVILSACETAAGEDAMAPAYSGLARAFAQAGARGLMLSHWRVRDDAAAQLTVATVRGATEGLPRAEALRRAQLALIADPAVPDGAHPAIWAPFVIIEN